MILVDTSVWVDHLRYGDVRLRALLNAGQVLAHPFVVGELALGVMSGRAAVLGALHDLPVALTATDAEVLRLIDGETLAGAGIGYIDAHLVASARITPDARLWTRDRRLAAVAQRCGIAI